MQLLFEREDHARFQLFKSHLYVYIIYIYNNMYKYYT